MFGSECPRVGECPRVCQCSRVVECLGVSIPERLSDHSE